MPLPYLVLLFFFFNDTATTEIYTLSLHDALPISCGRPVRRGPREAARRVRPRQRRPALHHLGADGRPTDRKSTRLNSSHANISYAVFCLKKKKPTPHPRRTLTRIITTREGLASGP